MRAEVAVMEAMREDVGEEEGLEGREVSGFK